MKKLNSKFTCDLEFYYFYSDFCPPLGKEQKNGGSVFAHSGYAVTRREGFDGGATRRRARASQTAGREAQGNP